MFIGLQLCLCLHHTSSSFIDCIGQVVNWYFYTLFLPGSMAGWHTDWVFYTWRIPRESSECTWRLQFQGATTQFLGLIFSDADRVRTKMRNSLRNELVLYCLVKMRWQSSLNYYLMSWCQISSKKTCWGEILTNLIWFRNWKRKYRVSQI